MTDDIRRILVALDTSHASRAALESAAAYAQRLDAELFGLFVEDLDLIQLAALPLARETGLASATARALDPLTMQRALEAQANQARRALERIARRFGVRATFRVARGHVASELVAAAAEADLVALGLSGQMEMAGRRIGSTARAVVAHAQCSVLIEHGRERRGETVALAWEDARTTERTLDRALAWAAMRAAELVVVPMVADSSARRDALLERCNALLARRAPLRIRVRIEAPLSDAAGLRALVARCGYGLVVVGADSELVATEPERLADVGCPVLIVR